MVQLFTSSCYNRDMDILSELNDQQRLAVEHGDGPLLILAGAGSGKTKTLTHRIAYLVRERGVRTDQILAVTFTNKASREMRLRLAGLLGGNADNRLFMPWMGTFHSICVRLLRIDGGAIGLDPRFVIYDEDDRVGLIKQVMKAKGLSDRDIRPKVIATKISNAKNEMRTADEFSAMAKSPYEQKIAEVYQGYEVALAKSSALDFDDLLIKTVELLRVNNEIRQKWRTKFNYILIDEYQDTNSVQLSLIKLLVNDQRNICVVGDDAQSIYSFRGADYRNILNFDKDFPGTTVIKLEQNYRSTGEILDLANKLIQHNMNRTDKNLWTDQGRGVQPRLSEHDSETSEAFAVAYEIQNQALNGRNHDDIAILYRTNAQSYAIERALRQAEIPYKIIGGQRFLDRAVVKDVLAYLRLIYQPNDRVSFSRIVNVPRRGIGDVSVAKFLLANEVRGGNIIENLLSVQTIDGLTSRARNSLLTLGGLLENLRKSIDNQPAELLEQIIHQTGYDKYVNDGSLQAEERMENLGVLVTEASAYADVESFLEEMSLMSSSDDQAERQVTMMTLHSAKGLEFPVVFLVGAEEGILPHARVFDSGKPDDIEEERRLCYVGVTRARKELFVSCARSRAQFGQIAYSAPSRFLNEMGLITESKNNTYQAEEIDDFYPDTLGYEIGDRVRSLKFGEGEIIDTDGLAVSVRFDAGGTKKLNVEFARLEKI